MLTEEPVRKSVAQVLQVESQGPMASVFVDDPVASGLLASMHALRNSAVDWLLDPAQPHRRWLLKCPRAVSFCFGVGC